MSSQARPEFSIAVTQLSFVEADRITVAATLEEGIAPPAGIWVAISRDGERLAVAFISRIRNQGAGQLYLTLSGSGRAQAVPGTVIGPVPAAQDPSFVIDAHCHIGTSLVSGVEITEAQLLRTMADNGIGTAMVMPQPHQGMEVAPIHDRIARFAEANPGAIYGMVNLSPRLEEGEYRAEIERCIRGHGFRAIKLDPSVSALPINHARCEIVFATAREYGVPVLIHTGMGVPNALPSLAIPPALRYPDVTIVLAHAGFAIFAAEAIVAAQICPNIVLEPSWCASYQVAEMVRAVGAERVMFGSDHPSNVASELAKLRSIGLTDEQLGMVLGGTARRVFGV